MNKEKLIPELRFPEFENEGEWDKSKLSSVSDVIMGSSPSSLSYNENKIGLPLLQGNADIKNRLSTPRIYTTEITKECEIGDILLSVRAPVGTVAKSLHNACIGRGISALRAKKPNSQEYIYQWLFSYESSWAKISQGGTFDAVNSDDIKNLLVPIPKPQEQQKIASCLSSLDALITAQAEKIEQLKLHKKGMMQNLFPQEGEKVPKYRFKEFENDGEWQEKSFENLFEIGNGRDYKHLGKGEIPVYGSGGYMLSVDEYLYDGDSVCIGRKGTIDKPMFLTGKFWTVDTLFYTHLFKNSLPKYIFYVFENINWREHNEAGGVPSLSKTNVYKIKVLVPPNDNLNEQQKIASCLSSLDALITAQSEKIEQLKLHKKGLMQGLFPKIEI